MPEPVDWQALRQVFKEPTRDGVARHSPELELLLDLAEERVGIMMDSGALCADAVAYAYRGIPHEFWPKAGSRNLTRA